MTVTLVDERQVPETSERSNARLVREHAAGQNRAAAANFVPLIDNADAAAKPCRPSTSPCSAWAPTGIRPPSFPAATGWPKRSNSNTQARIIAMTAPGAGEPRLTFTLPVLEATGRLTLHIEGAEKKDVLEQRAGRWSDRGHAGARGACAAQTPVTLYWAP